MSVKAINSSLNTHRKNSQQITDKQKNAVPSFKGIGNPLEMVTMVMDAVDRGGFAASFIIQDGIGMVAPRIWEGVNRNRKREIDPKTGEPTGRRTGPFNWEFARREGIRELLSGPSAFLIPAGMLIGIKKYSGAANNVHIDHINALGQSFSNYAESKIAANKTADLNNIPKVKEEFYEKVFKYVLSSSLDGKLTGEELTKEAKEFTKAYIEVEKSHSKGFWKQFIGKSVPASREDLTDALVGRYMNLRKKMLSSSINELDARLPVEGSGKSVSTSFTRVLSGLSDYTNDAAKHAKQYLEKNGTENISKYLKDLNSRRTGSRVISIAAMFSAVVGFYSIIPILYNIGLKHDPGLKGLVEENDNTVSEHSSAEIQEEVKAGKYDVKTDLKGNKKDNQPAFTGAIQTINSKFGNFVRKNDFAQKVIKIFEFDGPSMSVPAMLTLLFGFCLPTRYSNAKSNKERKEILVRDISSFTAILFGANALSRMASVGLSKMSGLVLNVKPEDHTKSIFHKVKNYFTPSKGITLLKGGQISQKYSNLEGFADRITGFVDFIQKGGGNIKRIFNMDKNLRKNVETILDKPLKDASIDEVRNALKSADDALLKNSDTAAAKAIKEIYKIFGSKNKFIKMAKRCNSGISAAATLVLTPMFMVWIARYCERMTKKRVAKEQEARAAESALNAQTATLKPMLTNVMLASQKPSMTGFLNH